MLYVAIVRVTAMSQGVLDRFLGPHLRMRQYSYLTMVTLSQYRLTVAYILTLGFGQRVKKGKEEETEQRRIRERLLYPSL